MITLAPYDDHAAMAVLSALDPMDHMEAQVTRGVSVSHLALFADWRAAQAGAILSLILRAGGEAGTPFAVLVLGNTGQAGVAQAAMLSRDHTRFRRPLIEAALLIRRDMPVFCAEQGIYRIEARSWANHPRAARFLQASGFQKEVEMAGFGGAGQNRFCQFSFTAPIPEEPN